MKYLTQKGEISRSEVIEYFTTLRMMTSIDNDGIAKETSLRTYRVLKKGLIFEGSLIFDSNQCQDFRNILALARRIGSMRNRGLGQIQCRLLENNNSGIESKKIADQ